jgi:hypothetical protein
MFGKKLDKISVYKTNLNKLSVDLKKLIDNNEIQHKHIGQILTKLLPQGKCGHVNMINQLTVLITSGLMSDDNLNYILEYCNGFCINTFIICLINSNYNITPNQYNKIFKFAINNAILFDSIIIKIINNITICSQEELQNILINILENKYKKIQIEHIVPFFKKFKLSNININNALDKFYIYTISDTIDYKNILKICDYCKIQINDDILLRIYYNIMIHNIHIINHHLTKVKELIIPYLPLNVTINFNTLIKLVRYNKTQINNTLVKTKLILILIELYNIKLEHEDLTEENIKIIILYDFPVNFLIGSLDTNDIKKYITPKIIEYTCVVNNYNFLETFMNNKILLNCDYNKLFKYSILNYNEKVFNYLLDNKLLPSSDVWVSILSDIELYSLKIKYYINKCLEYGMIIDKLMINCIGFICCASNNIVDKIYINQIPKQLYNEWKLKYKLPHNIGPHFSISNSNYKFNCESVDNKTQINIILTSEINIIFRYLYENNKDINDFKDCSLFGSNLIYREYLIDYCNYKPSFNNILKILNYRDRFMLLQRFYPELLK